ncbi:MAG: hypothetical protein JSU99_08510 [Nitrospiraceae bacterium]|nr:MAG: hypothetical protein JSU99_08510 [Nitrospiraceae bacterium]
MSVFIPYAHGEEEIYGEDQVIESADYDEEQYAEEEEPLEYLPDDPGEFDEDTGQDELPEDLPEEPLEYNDEQPLEEER